MMIRKSSYFCFLILVLAFSSCELEEEEIEVAGLPTPINEEEETIRDSSPSEENEECVPYIYLGENILSNGSFEKEHKLKNNQWNVFESLGAWKVDRDYNDAGIEIQRGPKIGGLKPSHGHSKLELDAHKRNGFTASDVAIYQDVNTNPAKEYVLSFDYAPRVPNDVSTNIAELYWDGGFVDELNSDQKEWQRYTYRLLGMDVATRLMFRSHIDDDTVGGYLDNIVLKEIIHDPASSTERIPNEDCSVN